ncbi:hypothetical protein ACFLT9_08870 [Acidobacteriota bacterium]
MKVLNKISIFLILVLVFGMGLLIDCKSPSDPQQEEQADANPSFANVIQAIFTTSCAVSGCHNATAAQGLDLSTGNARGNIVGILSTQDNTKNLVTAGDAINSYLVMKIEGRQTAGGRMPLGGSALSTVKIQNIKNWINNGANDN